MGKCPVYDYCTNHKHCADCGGDLSASDAEDNELPLLYIPTTRRAPKHPFQEKEVRQRRQRAAMRNERSTRQAVLTATKASGAASGDGDSRIGDGTWGIDDKLQSKASKQITVKQSDIDKASSQRCIVVITNLQGDKYVVAKLGDFVKAAYEMGAAVESYLTTTNT